MEEIFNRANRILLEARIHTFRAGKAERERSPAMSEHIRPLRSDLQNPGRFSALTLISRVHFTDYSRCYLTLGGELSRGTLSSRRRSDDRNLEAASRGETCALAKKIRSLRARGKLPVQTSNNDEPPPDEEFLFHLSQGPRRQARRFLSRQPFLSQLLCNDRGERRSPLLDFNRETRERGRLASRVPICLYYSYPARICFRERSIFVHRCYGSLKPHDSFGH